MKTSLPATASSNRKQPTRSVRASANRPSNYYAKPFSYRSTAPPPIENEPPTPTAPGFFPAITFFADAVAALPKEMQKYFTILKETEGKLHQLDQAIADLANSIDKLPDAPGRPVQDRSQAYMQLSLGASINGSAAASVINDMTPRQPQTFMDIDPMSQRTVAQDPHLDPRENLFVQLVTKLQETTSALDEKNMILSAANETLSRQLSRFDSAMPHIESEVSEDARLGSNTHWALPHMKELRRASGTGPTDRGRRDVTNVNNLAAAAQVVHEGEIAATRSEARREAMLHKRNRARDPDSDQEERTTSRKHVSTKVRKATDSATDNKSGVSGQVPKRRKVEPKPQATERSLGAALNGRLSGARSSPRGSPAPDTNRKKARPAPAPSAPRRKPGASASSITSSPTRGIFPTSSNRTQSPGRQTASKARQQSVQTLVQENARERRPSSASSTRKMGPGSDVPVSAPAKLTQDDTIMEEAVTIGEYTNEPSPTRSIPPPVSGNNMRRESAAKSERPDPTEFKQVAKAEEGPTPPAGRHSRAASRSSKPATPLSAVLVDSAPMIRPRSTRNGGKESNSTGSPVMVPCSPKRSHKKNGNGAGPVAEEDGGVTSEEPEEGRPSRRATIKGGGDGAMDVGGDEMEEEDEPRYCTCDRVSFGDMIACDNEHCPTEWFHLECVDLNKIPRGKAKWFCSERCRREARNGGAA